ncbi:hypothetical protein ACFWDI_01230 [Streptomyces sp. NPDC060064]|uniref:hypothetical protein n=1 Tax=Streptomyces sp. NPDC060064 TaxID=3347049 RepID=UPI003695117F
MSEASSSRPSSTMCPQCTGRGIVVGDESGDVRYLCLWCKATFTHKTVEVSGANAAEVATVIQLIEKQRLASRGPWRAGLFYLLALTVLASVFLVAASIVPVWVLPIVILGALIGLVTIGALQLRQDGRISEKGTLSLIKASFRTARSLGSAPQPPAQPQDPGVGSV